jgi:hypothetical protein
MPEYTQFKFSVPLPVTREEGCVDRLVPTDDPYIFCHEHSCDGGKTWKPVIVRYKAVMHKNVSIKIRTVNGDA